MTDCRETPDGMYERAMANKNPADRYPNTNRRTSRNGDSVTIKIPADVRAVQQMRSDGELARVRVDDRRALAIVAIVCALLIALVLLWPFGLDFTDHPCPLTAPRCAQVSVPSDLRGAP